jgi:hypothetical protein
VRSYKSRSFAEHAFRSLKAVDIEIRPIYHCRSDRVKGHILLCMLAYHVEGHVRQALAPILFDDHHRVGAQAARTSVIAPALISEAARSKLRAKTTEDGLPLHSFRTLLHDLAALTKIDVRFQDMYQLVTIFANASEA